MKFVAKMYNGKVKLAAVSTQKNFAKFREKHLSQSLFFNKVADFHKKRSWHRQNF